ncbi:RimK family alpha-L-glutamate ligase [Candidatus Poribacteria bacterium]|nr:RimK family alpha-L-glutamate ligase [Candidatus Poribacteria bacterium]MYK17793.1 RimK family alpha-L-glutamate ligase [Candidatus Poribacteria bacterium]
MKIGILSRGPQNHSTRRLSEAAFNAGHTAEILDPFGFYLHIGENGNRITYHGKPAEDFDVLVPRLSRTTVRYGEEVVAHFEWIGTPVVNRAKAIAAARHKFHSLRILAQHGLPVPPSLTVGSATFLENAVAEMGDYPFILKPFHGTHGKGVMLLDTPTSLTSAVDALCDLHEDYVIQPFIAEAGGVDIRVLVVGGEAIAAMKRSAPAGEFRANIHRGASGETVSLSETYTDVAIRAAAALELEIAGVDLLQTNEGPVVLEVNPSPGFEELESVTGVNIADAIIGFVVAFARGRG